MKNFGSTWLKQSVADNLRAMSRAGIFYGYMDAHGARYLEHCKGFHAPTGTLLIFTRDAGHHTSGWFKNPQYEFCLHLSISFREPFRVSEPRQFDAKLADEWVEAFFGEARRYAWRESSKSDEGKLLEVVHWRVFCDEAWQPFLPHGEVYSTEMTEKGWKSYSELHPEDGRKEPSTLHAG